MTNNSINLIALVGLGILTIATVTAPIWLPHILGIKPRKGECGVQITSNGFRLYCNNQY